jgi:hypothetical protein
MGGITSCGDIIGRRTPRRREMSMTEHLGGVRTVSRWTPTLFQHVVVGARIKLLPDGIIYIKTGYGKYTREGRDPRSDWHFGYMDMTVLVKC